MINDKLSIDNENCSILNEDIDLFIACIGYEERSNYIYEKIKSRLNIDNCLLFFIEDNSNDPNVRKFIDDAIVHKLPFISNPYADHIAAQRRVLEKIFEVTKTNNKAKIHIDYSSMPRSWYCKLPELIFSNGISNQVFFWYSEGEYVLQNGTFPTAGIETYVLYSGKPSLQNRMRTHFIGVGFDSIRTNGIITLLNPETIITCFANNQHREDIKETVENNNMDIFAESILNISLNISDFTYMISKMIGIVNEIYTYSDIILVPDGPKPLIFTMSMIPWLIGKPGICCLHMKRNHNQFVPSQVKALGKCNDNPLFSDEDHIIGFSITADI